MVARRALTVACSLASSVAAYTLPPSCRTLGAALHAAEQTFDQKGVPEALLSAEHLLTRAAGLGTLRSALAQQLDEPLGEEVRTRFEGMCEQRLRRVPVQYILGDWDFHALTLSIAPPVLIPRPETEQLVELVLETHADLDGDAAAPPRLLDVGCGSGAIGLALLNKMRRAECVGLDVRSEATELASRNAVTLGLAERYRAALVEGGIAEFSPAESECFDVIVSNPPYIPAADMQTLEPEVVTYEDEGALCGGPDGLDVVRQVLIAAPALLCPDGPRTVWLEIDPSHPPLIDQFVTVERADLGLELIRSHNDQYGLLRFCELRWRGGE